MKPRFFKITNRTGYDPTLSMLTVLVRLYECVLLRQAWYLTLVIPQEAGTGGPELKASWVIY